MYLSSQKIPRRSSPRQRWFCTRTSPGAPAWRRDPQTPPHLPLAPLPPAPPEGWQPCSLVWRGLEPEHGEGSFKTFLAFNLQWCSDTTVWEGKGDAVCNLVGFSVSGGRDGRGQSRGAILLIGEQVEENQRSWWSIKGRKNWWPEVKKSRFCWSRRVT